MRVLSSHGPGERTLMAGGLCRPSFSVSACSVFFYFLVRQRAGWASDGFYMGAECGISTWTSAIGLCGRGAGRTLVGGWGDPITAAARWPWWPPQHPGGRLHKESGSRAGRMQPLARSLFDVRGGYCGLPNVLFVMNTTALSSLSPSPLSSAPPPPWQTLSPSGWTPTRVTM